jgi:hypothetical protein
LSPALSLIRQELPGRPQAGDGPEDFLQGVAQDSSGLAVQIVRYRGPEQQSQLNLIPATQEKQLDVWVRYHINVVNGEDQLNKSKNLLNRRLQGHVGLPDLPRRRVDKQ